VIHQAFAVHQLYCFGFCPALILGITINLGSLTSIFCVNLIYFKISRKLA